MHRTIYIRAGGCDQKIQYCWRRTVLRQTLQPSCRVLRQTLQPSCRVLRQNLCNQAAEFYVRLCNQAAEFYVRLQPSCRVLRHSVLRQTLQHKLQSSTSDCSTTDSATKLQSSTSDCSTTDAANQAGKITQHCIIYVGIAFVICLFVCDYSSSSSGWRYDMNGQFGFMPST